MVQPHAVPFAVALPLFTISFRAVPERVLNLVRRLLTKISRLTPRTHARSRKVVNVKTHCRLPLHCLQCPVNEENQLCPHVRIWECARDYPPAATSPDESQTQERDPRQETRVPRRSFQRRRASPPQIILPPHRCPGCASFPRLGSLFSVILVTLTLSPRVTRFTNARCCVCRT